jgi:plasmid stabilization system protein ParE
VDYGLKITAQASRDLKRICELDEQNDLLGLTPYGQKLLSYAKSLRTFPYRHGTFLKSPDHRKVAVKPYLIFYKIDEENRTVEILRFWHAARDQRRLRLREEMPVYAVAKEAGQVAMARSGA